MTLHSFVAQENTAWNMLKLLEPKGSKRSIHLTKSTEPKRHKVEFHKGDVSVRATTSQSFKGGAARILVVCSKGKVNRKNFDIYIRDSLALSEALSGAAF